DKQARPASCGGTSARDTTSQIQDAGDTPGTQHPPAAPPQRTAINLNAPDAALVACTRSFRYGARSSPPPREITHRRPDRQSLRARALHTTAPPAARLR